MEYREDYNVRSSIGHTAKISDKTKLRAIIEKMVRDRDKVSVSEDSRDGDYD